MMTDKHLRLAAAGVAVEVVGWFTDHGGPIMTLGMMISVTAALHAIKIRRAR